jgi:hypothetical protein
MPNRSIIDLLREKGVWGKEWVFLLRENDKNVKIMLRTPEEPVKNDETEEKDKKMTEEPQQRLTCEEPESKTKQIALYLKLQPHDVIDIQYLMRRFQASAEDFRQAFLLLEQPLRN